MFELLQSCAQPLISIPLTLCILGKKSSSQQIYDEFSYWVVGWGRDAVLEGCRFDPRQGRQPCFMNIDHEIFSTVILSLQLIQEGQLSVSGERMCPNTG